MYIYHTTIRYVCIIVTCGLSTVNQPVPHFVKKQTKTSKHDPWTYLNNSIFNLNELARSLVRGSCWVLTRNQNWKRSLDTECLRFLARGTLCPTQPQLHINRYRLVHLKTFLAAVACCCNRSIIPQVLHFIFNTFLNKIASLPSFLTSENKWKLPAMPSSSAVLLELRTTRKPLFTAVYWKAYPFQLGPSLIKIWAHLVLCYIRSQFSRCFIMLTKTNQQRSKGIEDTHKLVLAAAEAQTPLCQGQEQCHRTRTGSSVSLMHILCSLHYLNLLGFVFF